MAKPIENTERVSTYIKLSQLDALRKLAKKRGMTVSAYLRSLIISSIEKERNGETNG